MEPNSLPSEAVALLAEQASEMDSRDLQLFEWAPTSDTSTSLIWVKPWTTSSKKTKSCLGQLQDAQHSTHVGDPTPIRQKPYRIPYSRRGVVEQVIQKTLEGGVIKRSNSPWASPIVIVGWWHVDYRNWIRSQSLMHTQCQESRRYLRALAQPKLYPPLTLPRDTGRSHWHKSLRKRQPLCFE